MGGRDLSQEEFERAKNYELLFGKYVGRTLDQVAETDEGLRYLDWLGDQKFLDEETKDAIRIYLTNDAIAKDLKALFGEGDW